MQLSLVKQLTPLDIVNFLKQLNTLIASGVPLIRSLEILEKLQVKVNTRILLFQIKRQILAGKTFHQSLQNYTRYFDALTCHLIRIGEETGKLELVLQRIISFKENKLRFKKELRQILFYPTVSCLLALTVFISMLLFIVPKFAQLFSEQQIKLPALTKFIFNSAKTLHAHFFLFFIFIFLIITLFYFAQKQIRFRKILLQIFNKLPKINSFIRKINCTHFVRNLALTYSVGMPIHQALTATATTCADDELKRHILIINQNLQAGFALYKAMQATTYFPTLAIEMVKVGEETGRLEEMLTNVAKSFEADIEELLYYIKQLIEPLIMILLGILIGGMVIAMYQPIFELGNAL